MNPARPADPAPHLLIVRIWPAAAGRFRASCQVPGRGAAAWFDDPQALLAHLLQPPAPTLPEAPRSPR